MAYIGYRSMAYLSHKFQWDRDYENVLYKPVHDFP